MYYAPSTTPCRHLRRRSFNQPIFRSSSRGSLSCDQLEDGQTDRTDDSTECTGESGQSDQMKTWSLGVMELRSVGCRLRAVLRYSSTPVPRKPLRLCLTLCAMLFALCVPASAQQPRKVVRVGYLSSQSPEHDSVRASLSQEELIGSEPRQMRRRLFRSS